MQNAETAPNATLVQFFGRVRALAELETARRRQWILENLPRFHFDHETGQTHIIAKVR